MIISCAFLPRNSTFGAIKCAMALERHKRAGQEERRRGRREWGGGEERRTCRDGEKGRR
jgi:hypothetical protein